MEVTQRLLFVWVLDEGRSKLSQFALLNYEMIKDLFYTTGEIIGRGIKREEGNWWKSVSMLKVVADKRRHLWELLSWVEVLAEGQGLFVWFNPKCKMKSKGLLLIYLLHLHRLHSLGILLTTVSTCSQNHKPSVLIFNLVSLFAFPVPAWSFNIRINLVFSGQTCQHCTVCEPWRGPTLWQCSVLVLMGTMTWGCGQVNQLLSCRQTEKTWRRTDPVAHGWLFSSWTGITHAWKNQTR